MVAIYLIMIKKLIKIILYAIELLKYTHMVYQK